jgi:hypothetical protein
MPDFTFPLETCNRLCVQTKQAGDWSEPREPTIDEVVAALHELPQEERLKIGNSLTGENVPSMMARLKDAEGVLDALDDVKLAIARLDRYVATYPDCKLGIPF